MLEIVGSVDTLARCRNVLEGRRVTDIWQLSGAIHEPGEGDDDPDDVRPPDRGSLRALVQKGDQQAILDALSDVVASDGEARIVLMPVDATEPEPEVSEAESFRQTISTPRQVLYSTVASGGDPNWTYYGYVVLATLVAAVGLLTDSVAVVIGAMVIAPLLGPLLALAFGATLGDLALIRRSVLTAGSGIALALLLSLGAGWIIPLELDTPGRGPGRFAGGCCLRRCGRSGGVARHAGSSGWRYGGGRHSAANDRGGAHAGAGAVCGCLGRFSAAGLEHRWAAFGGAGGLCL